MSLPPLPLIDGKLFVDNSGFMEGCSSCYRYLQYKNLNLRVSAAEKPALNFGSALHMMEELRYVRYGNGPVDDNFLSLVTQVFTGYFEQHPLATNDWRNLNWAIEITKKYLQRYPTEDFSLFKWDKPVKCPYCEGSSVYNEKGDIINDCVWCSGTRKREAMVEITFALPLYTHEFPFGHELIKGLGDGRHVEVIYTGRIDLPLFLDDAIWVMDHKHVGMLGKTFWDEQRMTAQHAGYAWAFEQITDKRVKGYIVDAVRTKEPPLYVGSGKTRASMSPEKWWAESFGRERFLCEPWKLEEWKNNTIDLVEEFFWHYSRGFMPQKTKWCSQYGRCPYYDVCTIAPEDRGVLLSSGQFTDNIWSPLKQKT